MLRWMSIAAVAATSLLAATPAARADDAAVKQVVTAQEQKIAPDNKAMSKAVNHLTKANAGEARSAITKVTTDITGYRAALVKVHASTSRVAKGRTALLTALREQRSGLRKLKTAIAKYSSGASDATVKKSVTGAIKKLKAGQKDAVRAAKLLGLTNH
jgi:hypothetical protein